MESPELRVIVMLRAAAVFAREYAESCGTVFYDEADCDGACLADDCDAAADALERNL